MQILKRLLTFEIVHLVDILHYSRFCQFFMSSFMQCNFNKNSEIQIF